MKLFLGTIVLMFSTLVFSQSEHLDDSIDYESMELRLEGCRHNLPLYFHSCIIKNEPYSEAQIGKAVKACNKESWHKFFDCTGLYPKGY